MTMKKKLKPQWSRLKTFDKGHTTLVFILLLLQLLSVISYAIKIVQKNQTILNRHVKKECGFVFIETILWLSLFFSLTILTLKILNNHSEYFKQTYIQSKKECIND
jgi:hypothetical protein